jgi:inosose dehydratase
VIELAAGRIEHVHVSDVDRALAEDVRHARVEYATAVGRGLFKPLGEGDAGVAQAVEAARRSGYRGWYGVEVERRLRSLQDDVLSDVRKSLALMRRLIPAQGSR